jgi:hypothetical protein
MSEEREIIDQPWSWLAFFEGFAHENPDIFFGDPAPTKSLWFDLEEVT